MMTRYSQFLSVLLLAASAALIAGCPPKTAGPGGQYHASPQRLEIETIGGDERFPLSAGEYVRSDVTTYTVVNDNYSVGYNIRQPGWNVTTTLYFYPRVASLDDQFAAEMGSLLNGHSQAKLTGPPLEMMTPHEGRQIDGRMGVLQYRQMYMGKWQTLDSFLIMYETNGRIVKARSSAPQGQAKRLLETTLDLMDQIKWQDGGVVPEAVVAPEAAQAAVGR